ncbi:MAG: sensor histidine kinase [Actinomycetales bacterium]
MRGLSIVVLATFVAIAAGLYVGSRHLANDQEQRLLEERTGEVGTLLSSAIGTGLTGSLTSLATLAQQPTTAAFQRAATSTAATGNAASVAFVKKVGTAWVVQASAGSSLHVGDALSGPRLALAQAADGQLRSDVFVVSAGQSRLGVVLGAPVSRAGTAVYEEFFVDPSRPARVTQAQPFHELNVALYVAPQATTSKLLLSTTSHLPIQGRTARTQVPVGSTSWLVVASARQPLSGSLASNVPTILALAALLIGLAMAGVVESVTRRRDYAVGLVAERTSELEDSLRKLEETQQALVTSERLAALGQMAATVGHELRNPLGVLTNALFLIRNAVSPRSDDSLRRHLDTADREISAATLIISDLLEFARPRAAEPTPTDIAELIDEAVSVAPPPTGVSVTSRVDDDVPPVVADRAQIRQVILNLLSNAYEAMPAGGVVEIGAGVVGGTIAVSVADSGIGMDEQTQARVFEPFFSLKTKGTGLGLAVSKRIIEAHAGTLSLRPRKGAGCIAVMSLPLSPVPVEA